MLQFLALVCLIQSSCALPTKTREEIISVRQFLSEVKSNSNASTFEVNMRKYPWSSAWENSGKYQGDIVLTDKDVEKIIAAFTRNAISDPTRLWPNKQIPFQFAGHTPENQNLIRGVMSMYHERTCVRFVQRTNQLRFVRLTDHSNGCYAHVGFYPNMDAHTNNLAPKGCMYRNTIFHELGHNIGFNHMHQAQVRDRWVRINYNNVIPGMEHNFKLLSTQYSNMLGLPYEYASNQHYGPSAFSRNGQPTIVPLNATAGAPPIQMGLQITYWDYLRVNRLYNCPGSWNVKLNKEDANTIVEMPSVKELIERGARFAAEEAKRIKMEPLSPKEIKA